MYRLDVMESIPGRAPSIYTVHYPLPESGCRTTQSGGGARRRHLSVLPKPLDTLKNSGLGWKEGQMHDPRAYGKSWQSGRRPEALRPDIAEHFG